MTDRIVVFDFAGTILRPDVIEQANVYRLNILGMPVPSPQVHRAQHATKSHYDLIRKKVSELYGIGDSIIVRSTEPEGSVRELRGRDLQTGIMTDLFRLGMYEVTKRLGSEVFVPGFLAAAQQLRDSGFRLAIVSGIRTDIITGVLAITNCPVHFDWVLGQDAYLQRVDAREALDVLATKGSIVYMVGDKPSDIAHAAEFGATSVLVSWGHADVASAKADFILNSPDELLSVLR